MLMLPIVRELSKVIVIGDIMTYLIMNGKKLKPFTLMEPLEEAVIDDLVTDLPEMYPDEEGSGEEPSSPLSP